MIQSDIKKFEKATRLTQPHNGDCEKAVSLLKDILKKYGSFKELHLNLGNAYRLLDEDERAFYHYKQSCLLETPFNNGTTGPWDMGWTNMGLMAYDHGDDELAIDYYKAAISINKTSYNALWNCGLSYLRRWCNNEPVNVEVGWKMYNYRFIKPEKTPLNPNVALWDGKTKVRRLAVLAEQGMGDRIHFGRYLKALENYCEELAVECDSSMDYFFQDYNIIRDGERWGADYGVPFCSLPAYLEPQSHLWLSNLTTSTGLLPKNSVIVEWTGSSHHGNSRHRNTVSTYFSDVFKGPNVYSFHNSPHRNIKPLGQQSWEVSCNYIKSSSLVVTVDTALAHVSGSMGVPTILIQPRKSTDFRWGREQMGFDNIWYPNVKVIRNPGSWDKTFYNLREYISANHQQIGY